MTEKQDSPKAAAGPLRPRRRRVWPMVLLSVVILLSGMAIGSGITLLWIQRIVLNRFRHPERVPAEMTARLRYRLRLTDEQAKQVEQILRDRQQRLRAIFREIRPRAQAEWERMRAEVAEVLTPEQAKKWNDYFSAVRRRWSLNGRGRPGAGMRGHGPPGGPADRR